MNEQVFIMYIRMFYFDMSYLLTKHAFIKHCNKSSVHLFFVESEFCLFVIIVVYPIIHAPLEGKGPMTLRARHSEQVYFNIGHTRMEMTNL